MKEAISKEYLRSIRKILKERGCVTHVPAICREREETISHVTAECKKLAEKDYTECGEMTRSDKPCIGSYARSSAFHAWISGMITLREV